MSLLLTEEEIFAAALLKAPKERTTFLDRACEGDPQLRAAVEGLLAAHDHPDSFLERPLVEATIDQPLVEKPGTQIGPYKLLQQIGEGGFGIVFMAEQVEPVRRRVALKVIKPGMDTRQVIARFEAERQVLAVMDHPNIAKVLDAGEVGQVSNLPSDGRQVENVPHSGRPYFVMELVRGTPITTYCDENSLNIRDRLALFASVCQAIQHAHTKGIIHRDIKPTNVLVTRQDGEPVAKVIDFGIAKAMGQQLTDKTLFTEFAQMIGTPLYMSPEQAELSTADIDTRSDIYSLGVLFYELLTGSTPVSREQLKQATFDEIRRIIREDEALKPSVRIGGSETLPAIAAHRHIEPARLSRLVRGELDWIVMKCLEKDRNRRYESASALAGDVQRYLDDEPVLACPPSAWYRFRKLARRNKRVAVMASFVLASLLVVVAVLGVSYAQVQEALQDRTQALEREQETTYLQRTALAGRELAAGNVGHAEELLDKCPAHLRGWEWRFLKRQRYDGEPTPLQHSATVINVAFSPDGRQLASVCYDGTFQIWDAQKREKLYTLEQQMADEGSAVLVRGMAYSRDSRYLALARHDGSVRVWDAVLGQPLYTFEEGHKGPAWQVAFSPDCQTLASGGSDGIVRLWDMTSGKAIQKFSEHPAGVKAVAFRPDGRSVLAACEDGTVTVWDRSTERPTFSFQGELHHPFLAWFSPDARRLAWTCLDGVVKIWDTTTGKLEIDLPGNVWRCRGVTFSPDGKRIALRGFDGTLPILDASNGREMLRIFAHRHAVSYAAFNHDGNKLASASYDHTVRIWDGTRLDRDPQVAHCVTLTGHQQLVTGVAFSPDGRWLASSSWDSTVKIWEFAGGRHAPRNELAHQSEHDGYALRYTLRHGDNVSAVAFSPDERILASAGWDKTVRLWDLQSPLGDSLTELQPIRCTAQVTGIAFNHDGRLLAIGQTNGIGLYDPLSGKEVSFTLTPAAVPALAFSPNSRYLASAGASDPAIKVWDVAANKTIFEIPQSWSPNSAVAISPDGRLIATPGPRDSATGPTVRIWEVLDWDAKTYQEWHTLSGHVGYVWRVTFSPNGRYLATGSWDSTIKIWDLKALQKDQNAKPVTLRGHAGVINGLAFSPDGRRLASGSGFTRGPGEVRVWDATLWENKANGGR